MSRIGYVVFKPRQPVDGMLSECARHLREAGVQVAGVIQALPEERAAADCGMSLRNLEDGTLFGITQDLGEGAEGCALDPQALTVIVQQVLEAMARQPQLVIVNRFGKAEADGHGLRNVFERALIDALPLLVAVREDFVPAWDAFHDGLAEELPYDAGAVLDWCREVAA